MPTKVVTAVKKVVTEPVSTAKAAVKAAAKPANTVGVGEIAIGVALGVPAGFLYSKGWEKLEALMPESWKSNAIVLKIVKLALPLAPMYFIKRFKVPFGTLINGLLFGIFLIQIGTEIYTLVKGQAPTTEAAAETADISLAIDYV